MPEKFRLTKNNDILIKLNDSLVAIPKELAKDNNVEPALIKSSDLAIASIGYEYKIFLFDLSKDEDRDNFEKLLTDISEGWWTGILFKDIKFVDNTWKAAIIAARYYYIIDNKEIVYE
jgi:hypothetical protein